jgi:hypothetical protein
MTKTTKSGRFAFFSASDMAQFSHDEWYEACRRAGCDMREHPEDEAIREELEARQRAK